MMSVVVFGIVGGLVPVKVRMVWHVAMVSEVFFVGGDATVILFWTGVHDRHVMRIKV